LTQIKAEKRLGAILIGYFCGGSDMDTWILVADEGRARLFAGKTVDGELTELVGFAHPEAHHPEAAARDRLPRVHESANSSRHAIQPRITAEQKQAEEFARALSEILNDGRVEHRYERLVLIAAPRFLGTMRAALDPEVSKLVSHTSNKDITKASLEAIREELRALD
jgi:protein required for attachment to host cells